ncbi:hypothetical protein DSCW_11610 [Desulfosarcina widdelii]|uniref:Glycosyltransferase 2-like domain-containing protein n=1 Tax=Desulfosarcina widdelii TaxID=947919 RepID=A0A5K7Z5L9_9BACT|nr:glycosyltransferase family 2 protein [Desulfosarcina widdelii]BBO73744.1 hypothetical protein DSCW_11610 [Desulfosarcina widdelii]
MSPLISIVTPSYNQGRFLDECIRSVVGQDYPNVEYVVIDGGSRDGSVDIIRRHEKQIKYWRSEPDGGQFEAIQEGFARTNGDVMAWINADDKYHLGAFSIVAEVFQEHPTVEWITGRPTAYDEHGKTIKVFDTLPVWSRKKYLGGAYRKCCIQQESTFWRRSLWERAGGHLDAGLQYAGDFELWIRFFRYARLYTIDALIGGFRYHNMQKTAVGLDAYFEEADGIVREERCRIDNGEFREFREGSAPITKPLKKDLQCADSCAPH